MTPRLRRTLQPFFFATWCSCPRRRDQFAFFRVRARPSPAVLEQESDEDQGTANCNASNDDVPVAGNASDGEVPATKNASSARALTFVAFFSDNAYSGRVFAMPRRR